MSPRNYYLTFCACIVTIKDKFECLVLKFENADRGKWYQLHVESRFVTAIKWQSSYTLGTKVLKCCITNHIHWHFWFQIKIESMVFVVSDLFWKSITSMYEQVCFDVQWKMYCHKKYRVDVIHIDVGNWSPPKNMSIRAVAVCTIQPQSTQCMIHSTKLIYQCEPHQLYIIELIKFWR